jgi:hypothetical protein
MHLLDQVVMTKNELVEEEGSWHNGRELEHIAQISNFILRQAKS